MDGVDIFDGVETLLEPSDVGRQIGRAAATVNRLSTVGILKIAAVTRRGVRLYRQADVDRLVEARKADGQL